MAVEFLGIGGGDARTDRRRHRVRLPARAGWRRDRCERTERPGPGAPRLRIRIRRARAAAGPPANAQERRARGPALKVITTRHPGRWVAAAAVAVLLAMAASALITNPAWEWEVFGAVPLRALGAAGGRVHPAAHRLGIVLGFVLGTVLALMRLSTNPLLRSVAWSYIWVFRSIPLIVQLLFWFNLALLYQRLSLRHPVRAGFFDVGTMDLIGPVTPPCSGWPCTRPPTPPRSSGRGPLGRPGPAGGRRRAGHPEAAAVRGSCCRRRCAPSCPTPPTR